MKRILIILLALCLTLSAGALAEGGTPEPGNGVPAGVFADAASGEGGTPDPELPDASPVPADPEPVETPEPTADPQAVLVLTAPKAEGLLSYGQAVSTLTLTGGSATLDGAEVEGSWEFASPGELLTPGEHNVAVKFVPLKAGWPEGTASVPVTVRKASPEISLPKAESIIYGQPLSESRLSGGSAVNPYRMSLPGVVGVFAWENRDYVPGVGEQACQVVFTPVGNDEDLYYPVYFSVIVTVEKRPVTVGLEPSFSGALSYSCPVGSLDIGGGTVTDDNGCEVPGTWAPEEPDAMPKVGTASRTVVFTPLDSIHYRSARVSIPLEVVRSRPVLVLNEATLPAGADITAYVPSGTAVDAAGTPVEGVFSFAEERRVAPGSGEYAVVFTPADSVLYEPAAGVCAVTGIEKDAIVEASWSGVYGQPLSRGVTVFSAVDRDGAKVDGDLHWKDASHIPAFGEMTAEAVFTPSEAGYTAVTVSVTLDIAPRIVTVTPVDEMNVFSYGAEEGSLYYTLSEEVAVTGALARTEGDGIGEYPVLPGTLASAEEGIELELEAGHTVKIVPDPDMSDPDAAGEFLMDEEGFRDAEKLAVSPDGRYLAALDDGTLTVADLLSGTVLYTGAAQTPDVFAFGPDGKLYLDEECFDIENLTFTEIPEP